MDPRIRFLGVGLDSRRAALAAAFDAVPAHLRELSPGEGHWSVARVLEHLAETERAVTPLVAGLLGKAASRSSGDPFVEDAFSRHVELPLFLDRSRRLEGSQPAGEMDASRAWAALERSRVELGQVVERGAGLRLEDVSRPHPFAGDLDLYQWIAFVGLHEARHAAQILEIVRRLKAGTA